MYRGSYVDGHDTSTNDTDVITNCYLVCFSVKKSVVTDFLNIILKKSIKNDLVILMT